METIEIERDQFKTAVIQIIEGEKIKEIVQAEPMLVMAFMLFAKELEKIIFGKTE